MNSITKSLLIIATVALLAAAPADKFTDQMKKCIGTLYAARTPDDYQKSINTFNRIGDAEKTKWEPFYYSALGSIFMASGELDALKKDAILDIAKQTLDKASAVKGEDSEIVALEGFIQMLKVTVDPATRGPQYSMQAVQLFSKAMTLDPANPRATALMAQMQLGTARFFNQAPTEACATARKAAELFDAAKFSEDSLQPVWGQSMNEGVLAECK
jgi:hypothetical protein